MSVKNYGAFYATLSGLFFGLIGYFGVSIMNAHVSVNNMLFWRFLVSGLFIILLLTPNLKSLQIGIKEIGKISFYGAAFYGTCSILYFLATEYIGSGLAMVIFFTYPSIVLLINFAFFKQTISKIYYLSLTIIFSGMLLMINGSKVHFDLIGVGLSLLSAILYAMYLIVSKNCKAPALVSTLFVSLGAMLVSLFAALWENSFFLPLNVDVWFNICGIGVVCTALPIVFLLEGLKHISSLQASILSVLEPVFVVIFGILLLGEKINITQASGVVILLAGALLSLLSNRFER
ncbi:DMT family transporter [Legionella jordanis]|uniref:Integral membrane protein n=1 Tax=Legionella jordanis TaxID=456 RepID=A0A0W0VBJ0_9GAMM|nr:DMT family transporter [Legionella jordanis]KTD17238.1 integral membrane protein [Legionella jordanis]VEH12564.1 permease, DMT superfamily [Legionella jordanis]